MLPTFVKKYPKDKPFVYKTNIKLIGNLSKTQKSTLQSQLNGQLEDSVKARPSGKVLWQVIKKPPAYDTFYVSRSIKFMDALLFSSGYFHHSISYDTIMRYRGSQQRTTINFNVSPGPVTILDSVWYSLGQAELQKLADSTKADSAKTQRLDSATLGVSQPLQKLSDSTLPEAFLKKGSTFSQDTIAMELDRLVTLYRNNGYLRFTRNELVGVWDTLDVDLLRPMADPLEQLDLLRRLAERQKSPTATLEIGLRPGYDSSRLTKFYVGNVFFYPDFGPDTLSRKDTIVLDSNYTVIQGSRLFKPKILPQSTSIRRGQAYNQNRYIRTVNRFNTLIAWRLVNVEQKPRPGTDTVDFFVKLTPAIKYLFSANLEGSRNDNNLFAEGNLLGLGVNMSLQNRNFARVAAQTNLTVRYGTELSIGRGQQFVSSRQASIGYNIFFPRFVPRIFGNRRFREATSVLAFNIANTQRINLYNLTTFNTSWGYNWQRRNKFYAWKMLNIEYAFLQSKPDLDAIFLKNPGLKNVFNDGLVVSTIGSFTWNFGTKKNINTFKANLELSGFPGSSSFIRKNIYRYIKPDIEIKRLMKISPGSDLVARMFLGIGIPFKVDTGNGYRSQFLPFFKAFGGGGPNSMRGWGLRRVGPGSANLYYDSIPDRFGDMQFETNIEYRFHAFDMFGFRINSVLFTDIGNVWFLHKNPGFPDGEFKLNKFFKELAVDVGTGLRVDLGFFLVRLDYAWKVVNPFPEPVNKKAQYKWFYDWQPSTLWKGTLQFGVTYPF